jgi:hypothetical protein
MQLYQNELTDLLIIPSHQNGIERKQEKKIPYFVESGAEYGSNFMPGTNVVMVSG